MAEDHERVHQTISEFELAGEWQLEEKEGRMIRRIIDKTILKLKHAYWRVREALLLSAICSSEVTYRLRRRFAHNSGFERGTFWFPWGGFEYVNAGNLLGQYEEIFVRRQYAFLSDAPEPVIIDCGGNVGLSAIFFKLNYPRCRLTVYEADPDLAAILRANLERAGMADVLVHNVAVWITNGAVPFQRTGDDSGKISDNSLTSLPSVDFVEYLPDCVDLLKMDIEGAEFSVLTRLCQTGGIEKIKCLVCEMHIWHDKTDAFLETLSLLRGHNMEFRMNASVGPYLGLAVEKSPFEVIERKQVLMELFAWRNCSLEDS
jgi:FkbM family methyltransferase